MHPIDAEVIVRERQRRAQDPAHLHRAAVERARRARSRRRLRGWFADTLVRVALRLDAKAVACRRATSASPTVRLGA